MLICSEQQMRELGARLIDACDSAGIITLQGNLGTGKTTLVRGALEARGITSGVRSPTYTLVEYYELDGLAVAHLDLYRLADPEELEYLGFRDYLESNTLCLIEWPERASGYLEDVGLQINLDFDNDCRQISAEAYNDWGKRLIQQLKLD